MRRVTVAILLASSAAVSSCASRVETRLEYPPVADLKVDAEPIYPVAALEACPTDKRSDPCPAQAAEDQWWNSVLQWGRAHHDRVARLCSWAVNLGLTVPDGYCDGAAVAKP